MPNIRKQVFVVTVETKLKDGFGNDVSGFSAGDIRYALAMSLPRYDYLSVDEKMADFNCRKVENNA